MSLRRLPGFTFPGRCRVGRCGLLPVRSRKLTRRGWVFFVFLQSPRSDAEMMAVTAPGGGGPALEGLIEALSDVAQVVLAE